MSNKKEKLTAGLVTPTCKKEFTNANGKEWARRIIVDYMKKSDPDWLLASVLKVLDVVVKDNTSPGKQCRFGQADYCGTFLLVAVKVCTVLLPKFVIYYHSEN